MKTYFKLVAALLLICAPVAYSQDAPSEGESSSSTMSAAAKEAQQGIIDSVANNDKAKTLELLAAACQAYPQYAADFVAALLKAILDANQGLITARGVSAAGESPNVNAALVGEIVATAITAAPGSQTSVINSALEVAPYAATQINSASLNPLTFPTSQGLAGNTLLNPDPTADDNDDAGPTS